MALFDYPNRDEKSKEEKEEKTENRQFTVTVGVNDPGVTNIQPEFDVLKS